MPNKALLNFCNQYYRTIETKNSSLRQEVITIVVFMNYFDVVLINDPDLRREVRSFLEEYLKQLDSMYNPPVDGASSYSKDTDKYRTYAKYILKCYLSIMLKSVQTGEITQESLVENCRDWLKKFHLLDDVAEFDSRFMQVLTDEEKMDPELNPLLSYVDSEDSVNDRIDGLLKLIVDKIFRPRHDINFLAFSSIVKLILSNIFSECDNQREISLKLFKNIKARYQQGQTSWEGVKCNVFDAIPVYLDVLFELLSHEDFMSVLNSPDLVLSELEKNEYTRQHLHDSIENIARIKQKAMIQSKFNRDDVKPGIVSGLFLDPDDDSERKKNIHRAYKKYFEKYQRINKKADSVRQFPFTLFLLMNIQVIVALVSIMNEKAFQLLGNLTAQTVLQMNRYCQTIRFLPEPIVVHLHEYFNRHTEDIMCELELWKNILLCAAVLTQVDVSSVDRLARIISCSMDKSPQQLHQQLNNTLFELVFVNNGGHDEMKIESDHEVDFSKVFNRIPEKYFVRLIRNNVQLAGSKYASVFNRMLLRDCVPELGTVHDLCHNEEQKDEICSGLARHNNRIRDRLREKGVNPESALHYQKKHEFSYVDAESKASAVLSSQDEVLFSYLSQLVNVLDGFGVKEDTKLYSQINSIKRRYNRLCENTDARTQVVPLGKPNNKALFNKIMRNVEAISQQIKRGKVAISADLKRHFNEFYEHVKYTSSYLDHPTVTGKSKSDCYHFSVEFVDKNSPEVFFLADEVGCCLATDGAQFNAIIQRRMDDAMQFLVVRDKETGRPAALMWLYLSENSRGEIELRMNFPEVNAKYAGNDALRQTLLFAMCEFCEQYVRDHAPGIKRFLLNSIGYGWNQHDLEALPTVTQEGGFDKLGGPFLPNPDRLSAKVIMTQDKYYLASLSSKQFHRYDPHCVPQAIRKQFASIDVESREYLLAEVNNMLVARRNAGDMTDAEYGLFRQEIDKYGVTDALWAQLAPVVRLHLDKMLRPFCDSSDVRSERISQIRKTCRRWPLPGLFSRKQLDLINNRHSSFEAQRSYDCEFGLIKRP